MSVTGHKSVSSLAVYQRISPAEKMAMDITGKDTCTHCSNQQSSGNFNKAAIGTGAINV